MKSIADIRTYLSAINVVGDATISKIVFIIN